MVTWDIIDESWDALGTWIKVGIGTSEISPAGQLHQLNNAGRRKLLTLPTQFTLEARLKIDGFNGQSYLYECENNPAGLMYILIESDKIKQALAPVGYDEIAVDTTEGTFYVWRFLCDFVGGTIKVYRDASYIGEFTNIPAGASDLVTTQAGLLCDAHEDYLKIATDLHSPVASE